MKNEKRMIRLLVTVIIIGIICAAALIWVAMDKRNRGEPLALPSPDEVTVCYYVPDLDKPYEQIWLGGEKLAAALSELAALEFAPADAPDEDSFTACFVIATNDEQVTVHVDEAEVCWVWSEERGCWLAEVY